MGTEKIAVLGLGYVGLPVALAFAEKFPGTVGFDINAERVAALKAGIDPSSDIPTDELKSSKLQFTCSAADLKGATFFVVAVPTPVDNYNKPDMTALKRASETVGKVLTAGAVVVYESTVYPGVTEEICGPILAQVSGLKQGVDFKLGYSPERINPGDLEHTLQRVIKVVAGEDAATLERVSRVYSSIIQAGVHQAPSIKVAEAAKVIENTQRDLNIALMNELAIIFDKMGIATADVLDAAATKWNFLRFSPGLVGGHCIGVDPYYLTTKAEQLGYHPQVILAGRRINDGMGQYIAQRLVKLFGVSGIQIKGARVGVLGLTFKENVSDLRNSRVPDIIRELKEFGVVPLVNDPLANAHDAEEEYGVKLLELKDLTELDGVVFAVSHKQYLSMPLHQLTANLKRGGVLMDVKSAVNKSDLRSDIVYWSL